MGALAFFLCAGLITVFSFALSESLQIRRRRARRELMDSRGLQPDTDFTITLSALSPVPENFARAFRLASGRALGVEPHALRADDRLRADLRVYGFEAIELAAVLERAFDVRVRVLDVWRARSLRELCRQIHERAQEISEADPPLHREPVPKLSAPEPVAVEKTQP